VQARENAKAAEFRLEAREMEKLAKLGVEGTT
jgi:diketogulonate reductase-like aldo/keto reductase